MQVFRGIAAETDMTMPQLHSITAIARPLSFAWTSVADTSIRIYTRDRMAGNQMAKNGGKPVAENGP
jgi:hypothetical protein